MQLVSAYSHSTPSFSGLRKAKPDEKADPKKGEKDVYVRAHHFIDDGQPLDVPEIQRKKD